MPVRGQVSAYDSAALGDGDFALLQNVRWSDGPIRVRGGLSEYRATTGLASGTVVGAMFDKDAGDFIALNLGSSVAIYKFFSGQWRDINASNRLGNVSRVWFEKFTMPSPGDTVGVPNALSTYSYVVVQDGTSAPQIIQNGVGTTATVSVAAIAQPSVNKCDAIPFSFASVNIANLATATITSSTTSTTMSHGTITAGSVLNFNLTTTTATSQNVIIPFTQSFTSTQASQLQIVHNANEVDIWDQVAIEVGDATNWYLIHLPGLTPFQTSVVGDRYVSSLFDCRSVGTSSTSSTISDFISFPSFTATRMRFTYVASAAPVAAKTIPIYAIAYGENVPFDTQFAVTFYQPSTAVESAPTIARNTAPPALKRVGGTPLPGVTLSGSPAAKYGYRIQYQEQGVGNYAYIYARQGGTYTILDFAPNFTTATGEMNSKSISTLAFGRWELPSSYCREMPRGGAMAMSGDRLYVAANNSTGTALKRSRLLFSEKGYPNRFAFFADVVQGQVQPKSGGSAQFGDETITALAKLSGYTYGGEGILAWTEQSLYQLAGIDALQLSRPSNIAPYGTVSPDSIARFRNTVVWVTPDREIRYLGGDLGDISSRLIEDVLKGIPEGRLDDITSTVFQDRLYVGYTPTGSTNTNALVYDARTGGWSIDTISTLSGASFARFVPRLVGNENRLLCLHTTGWTFEYDLMTATGDRYVTATTIVQPTIKLRTKSLSNGFLNQFRVGDILIVADDMGSGVTWATKLLERKTGDTESGVLNMFGNGDYVWRYNRGSVENERVGAIDLGVQVEIEGQAAPSKAVYSLAVVAEEQTEDGADRA